MRRRTVFAAACFILLTVPTIAFPSSDGAPRTGPVAAPPDGGVSAGPGAAERSPACGFADIAYSEVFRTEGLAYVSSADFAAALRAVASGDSKYSPAEIPPGWRAAAADWEASRPGLEPLKALGDRASNIPALVYLASMEYRLRTNRPRLKPAYPVLVRAATRDLEARAVAKRELASKFAERSDAIGLKLYTAELMGATGCAPGAVADAKARLAEARREATDLRSSVEDAESSFRKAERFAEMLLARQQLASKRGLRCYAE